MTALRVLHVAHDHPEWTSGGTEILAHDLARAMDARGGVAARLLVAATSLQRPDAAPGALEALGEDFVLRTGAYDRFTLLRRDGDGWVEGLARVLATARPHIAHFHGLDRIGAEAIPAVRRLAPDCRIVLTLHDYQLICANEGLLLTTTDGARCGGAQPDRCRRCFPEIATARHALRQAHLLAILHCVDRFLAPSAFLRDRFVAWGIAPHRIEAVGNAVDRAPATADPAPPRRKRSRTPADPAVAPRRRDRFAFFGNIAPHKGVLVLLDAASRLARSGADLRLALHGGLGWAEPAFRDAFASRLQAAAPVAQHFGPYDRADVVRLMAAADWIVAPSIWWENAPLVILEARAAGRPVIVSGVGGMAELVADGVDGLHVPPGDAAALAETMAAAAADPDLWARLAGAAHAPSHAAYVDAHLALYRGLLERAPA